MREPEPGADLALVYCGPVAAEATAAHDAIRDDAPETGLLAVTSPDRLHADWRSRRRRASIGCSRPWRPTPRW
jgi:pyruvate dehydrogenase E1 component